MKKLVPLLTLIFSFCFVLNAYAVHTSAGVPNTVSYVTSNSTKRIIIMVGDSRTMQCTYGPSESSVRTNYVFCYVNGGNIKVIDYDSGKLAPYLKQCISKYRKKNPVVVFNLGVNGNSYPKTNANRAIKIYNKWMKEYKDIDFYVESIWPSRYKKSSYSNKKIIKFNSILKNKYVGSGKYIPGYEHVKEKKLTGKMRDKLHYNWTATKSMLKFTRNYIENS